MRQKIEARHTVDEDGNPAGGQSLGVGIKITWQDGPLGKGTRREKPNGAFVEGVIQAAIGRLEWYQSSPFECEENRQALVHLELALGYMDDRTARRESEGTEGTHAL